MGIYDVPAGYLIDETAKILATELEEPKFAGYVKTGMHRERAPLRQDWFFVRAASILYRAYKWGTIGTEELRSYYGGRKNRGLKREHHYKAGGKIIRLCVQQLEKKGYLEKAQPKGRKISVKGFKLLNEMSKVTAKNLAEGKYVKKEKIIVEDKKKKEIQETLRKQDHGQGKPEDKKRTQKSTKKKDAKEETK